jgi:4-amino-4-deoxy-L-arabinose transferase-like glycosyltransferase
MLESSRYASARFDFLGISDFFRISGFGFRICGLIAFCGSLFFLGLGDRDLTSSHEARAAQNAQMILDEGHWLVPRLFDQHLELQKPPLYYWLVAILGWLNGGHVDVWAVRLPAALSALACVLFLVLLGVQAKRPIAGLIAALVLASCLHFTWLARVGRIDMPLTMTITFALGGFYLGNREGQRKGLWHLFAYISLALGLLLKGPIALVLPTVVVGIAWLVRDHRLQLRGTSLIWGVPLMLAIAAPWFVWANYRTDNQLFDVFFWYHNVERGLGGSEVLRAHPWWFYLAQAPFDMLPWSLAVPAALYVFIRNREIRMDDAACLGLLWFGAVALFLSCMSFKRADYLLPAYPGLAIFLGACAERWWRGESIASRSERARGLAVAGFLGILLVCVAGWLVHNTWFLSAEERAWPYRQMAQEIRRQTHGPVVFFRAESHLLTYHLGHPVTTVLEWENLERWANRPLPVYIVMPESCAEEWGKHLTDGSLVEVLRTRDYVTSKHPMVILRNRGKFAANP